MLLLMSFALSVGLISSFLPCAFPNRMESWNERTACHISNRIFIRSILHVTPSELRFGHKPFVSHFRPFGCKSFVLKRGNLAKFESRSFDGILLGYTLMAQPVAQWPSLPCMWARRGPVASTSRAIIVFPVETAPKNRGSSSPREGSSLNRIKTNPRSNLVTIRDSLGRA
jgi:hypothetical protein